MVGRLPTDLAAETGLVAGTTDGGQTLEEVEKDGFEKVPVFGADGEEGAKPELGTFGFVDVEGGEVAEAGGGDVEAEAERGGME
jgi:hypothetical protein